MNTDNQIQTSILTVIRSATVLFIKQCITNYNLNMKTFFQEIAANEDQMDENEDQMHGMYANLLQYK